MGIALVRHSLHDVCLQAVDDFVRSGTQLVRLSPEDMHQVVGVSRRFNLDFADAYQYPLVEKHNLILVSFDGHFDRTERGRKIPRQILSG